MQQYEKYRRVEPSERGTAMFDEMLRLKRENMILEDENKTLKKKIDEAFVKLYQKGQFQKISKKWFGTDVATDDIK